MAIGFAISVLREPGRIPLGNIFASLVAILVGFFAMLCSLVETLVAVGVPVSERSATALGRWLASKERRCVPPLPPALPAGERENGVLVRRLATA